MLSAPLNSLLQSLQIFIQSQHWNRQGVSISWILCDYHWFLPVTSTHYRIQKWRGGQQEEPVKSVGGTRRLILSEVLTSNVVSLRYEIWRNTSGEDTCWRHHTISLRGWEFVCSRPALCFYAQFLNSANVSAILFLLTKYSVRQWGLGL